MKNKKIVWGVVGVVVLVAVFYGGMAYAKSQVPARGAGAFARGGAAGALGAGGARGGFAGLTTGSIIAKDSKSVTIQVMGGGSKIIFLDDTTKISKQTDGTLSDLAVGTNVSITGAANSDGSVNATSVQIRPAMTVKNTTP